MKKPVVFIVGPTAGGKTAAAVILAKKLKTQIISCDSMQVYKHLDIATAKISKAEMQGVKHHLISIIPPEEEYSVAAFRQKALRLIKKFYKEGIVPLLVGGSGLYMQILLDGIFEGEPPSDEFRQKLNAEIGKLGSGKLHQRLAKLDPEAAQKIHANDKRRIVRALEVFYALKMPITEAKKRRQGLASQYNVYLYGLNRERKLLYQRIDERVDEMFAGGLVKEAKILYEKHDLSKTARAAVGYKELFACFRGEYGLEEARRLIKRNTRHYAKRQLTWFNKEKRITWVNAAACDTARQIAEKIYEDLKTKL